MEWYGLKLGSGVKYDIAVKGDSFTNKDVHYLEWFFKSFYDMYNGVISGSIEEAKAIHESAGDRCVTIKAETRADQVTEETCEMMLRLGITTVEIGVQSLYDRVLEINRRGHDVETVGRASALLRRSGFEFGYHMMVGMPGSVLDLDYQTLCDTLWQKEYSPDILKLYPCILYRNMPTQKSLEDMLVAGKWHPLTDEQYLDMLDFCLPRIPSYVHINRIQRMTEDSNAVGAGPSKVIERSRYRDTCKCLWQRSPAQVGLDLNGNYSDFVVRRIPQGEEGICVEALSSKGNLLGYGRISCVDNTDAIVRDLRVLGNMLLIGQKNPDNLGLQHVGIGRAMLMNMEQWASAHGRKKVLVHPAPGVREYFMSTGYQRSKKDTELGYFEKDNQ
jgi:elongator complex protein 3